MLETLLKKINSRFPPVIIPVLPEAAADYDQCFFNVKDKVAKDGGAIIYGWNILQTPILLEAEKHAIWQSRTGKKIDITPNRYNQKSIQFVQDDTGWTFDGQFVDNIRVNYSGNPLVDDYIKLAELITLLYQTGSRVDRYRLSLLEPVLKTITYLEKDKANLEKYIYSGAVLTTACYCASGLSYQACHGNGLDEGFAQVLARVQTLVNNHF